MENKGLTYLVSLAGLIVYLGQSAAGQQPDTVTLEKCRQLAVAYSTLSEEKSLQRQVLEAEIRAENTGYLPQAEVSGQATYQSDVTGLPVSMPGVETMAKDQYKASLGLQQVIFHGGAIARQKRLAASAQKVEQSRLDVDLQKLKERVDGLYLSVLLIHQNVRLVELFKAEISTNIQKLSVMLEHGVTTQSNLDLLKVEHLKADQKLIELSANKIITLDMLSNLLGRELRENTVFVQPKVEPNTGDASPSRPEYRLFDNQKAQLHNRVLLLDSKILPKLSVFANGGYGRPGLNMLNNEFDWFYLAGARLSIPLTSWTRNRELKKSLLKRQSIIESKREAFSRNTRMQLNRKLNEINKYKQLINKDKAIIAKRTAIKEMESVKLANGVSTSTDFITQLNAENQAILNKKLHEIQLLQSIIQFNALKGYD